MLHLLAASARAGSAADEQRQNNDGTAAARSLSRHTPLGALLLCLFGSGMLTERCRVRSVLDGPRRYHRRTNDLLVDVDVMTDCQCDMRQSL